MEEDTLDQRFRRRRSGRRSSSILKTKTPLLDIDTNQAVTEVIPRKKARISSSRRVSFAETYQVKEFPRDSPHRWMPDPESEDDSSPELERLPDVPQHTSRGEIQGLDKLLTGPIQTNSPSEEQIESELPLPDENVPYIQSGPNHTILQTDDMDMTDCFEKSNVEKPIVDDFGDNYGASFCIDKFDRKSFLPSIGKPVLENISEKLFLPDKKFSNSDSNNMYKVEQESDFHTLINTSINKYSVLGTSVTTTAGASVTFTTNVTSRKPLTSISDRSAFKPITTESYNPLDGGERPVSKVDGLSFLKQLTFKASESQADKYEERTIVFDGNDMEETEVLTKCIQNSEKESLILESVKVPSFLKSKKISERSSNNMFFGQCTEMDNHTVFFGEDNNMEDTEVIGSQINFGALPNQKSQNTFLLNNGMELKIPTTVQIRASANKMKGNENTVGENATEKTQIFDKGLDMEQTEMLTGKLNYVEGIRTFDMAKTNLSDDMEETGLLTSKIDLLQSSKLLEKNKTVLYKNDDMEETNVLSGVNPAGCRKSFGLDKKNKTCLFADGNDMEQTTVFTNKIELPILGKQEDTKISDNSMEETNVLTQKIELPKQAKNIDISNVDNKTLLYQESNDMEETRTVTGKIDIITNSDKEQERENRTKLFSETNYMEETCTVTSKSRGLSYVKENKTTIFTEDNGMEETCALTSKVEYLSCVKKTSLTTGNSILVQTDGTVVNKNHKLPIDVNNTIVFNEGNQMEQTRPINTKIKLDSKGGSQSSKSMHFSDGNEMEEKEKIKVYSDTQKNKTVIFPDDNEMEQTQALTGKLEIGSHLSKDKTLLFKDNDEMEQTRALTGKLEIGSHLSKDKTLLFKDNNEMEQTQALTGKLEIGSHLSKDKTLLFKDNNEMEQTQALTGKLEIGSLLSKDKTLLFKDNNEMEQTQALTGKLEIGSLLSKDKTLLFKDNDEMEQTRALTGKLEIGSHLLKDKTLLLKDNNEMEQTQALTGKLEIGSLLSKDKTLLFKDNNEMEQTQALTGKLEIGSLLSKDKTLLFKDNDEMEQTRALTGKLEIGSHLLKDKTLLFKDNNEMEQTQALTGKLEIGSLLSKDKTLLFKDNNEMEQTQALTGKLEIGSLLSKDKTLLFKDNDEMEQTQALTGKLEIVCNMQKNKTPVSKDDNELEQTKKLTEKLQFDPNTNKTGNSTEDNEVEQTTALTGNYEFGLNGSPDKEDEETDQPDAKKSLLEADSYTTQNKTEQFKDGEAMEHTKTRAGRLESDTRHMHSSCDYSGQLTENDIVKNKYRQDIEEMSQNHSPGLNMLETEVEMTSQIENKENVGKNKIKGGISSLIEKIRKDMNSDKDKNSENPENRRESASPDITDGFFFKYKAQLESVKKNAENVNNDFNVGNQNLSEMVERIDKNACKSLHTRTPNGKMFGTSRDYSTEVRPPVRGSTVKISERVIQTEHKPAPETGQHQPMHCSKELFSNNDPDFDNTELMKNSSLPILESSTNITIRERSKSDGRSDDPLELPSGITDIYMPAELLTSTTISSVPPENTTNYQLNLTSSSAAIMESDSSHSNLTCSSGSRSVMEINMEDYLKQSMMNDSDDGSMTVEHFCKRINMLVPLWLKERIQMARQSIATLKKVDKDSIRGQIEAKYVHEPYISIYNTVIEQAKEKLSLLKPQTKELHDTIKEEQPAVFDVAVKGSEEQKFEMKEKVFIMRKYCSKQVDKEWKDMKLHCHGQFYDIIKEKREKLSEEVNEVVQASDTIQRELSELSNASNQLDKLILELEQKPIPEPEDIEYLNSLDQEVKQKEQEIEGIKETQVDLDREKLSLQTEKTKLQKEEQNINNEDETDDNIMVQLEIQELEEKLDTLESLTEWHIENYEDDFITFLFYDDTLRLSINKQKEPDNGQTKIASAHVQSLLEDSASPCMKLIHVMILQQINNGDSLHHTFSYISDLPELLQKLSQIVLNARCLKRQIISLCFKYIVTVYKDFVVVEKWSLKSLRKVNIKLTFNVEDACCNILPEVTVKMGRIRAEDVQDQISSVSRGQNYLVKLCDSVDLDVLSDSSKFS